MTLNFDQKLFSITKEMANLKRLGFKIPVTIAFKAQEIHRLTPLAQNLQESLRIFHCTEQKVNGNFEKLIAQMKNEVQSTILDGLKQQWKIEARVEKYAQGLHSNVLSFEKSVNMIIERVEHIEEHLEQLANCELNRSTLSLHLKGVQTIIDEFNFLNFSNLHIYVEDELDSRVEGILKTRLE